MTTQPPPKKRLTASIVPAVSITPVLVEEAFALFEEAYAGADRSRFAHDLADKQLIIVLRDRDTGGLKGFSTVRIERRHVPRRATVIFSGDTVIHRDYWGQKQLQMAFMRILLARKLRAPHRPLYWFLLSKGYRTYMLLANAFPHAVPRCDGAPDPKLQTILNALAVERYRSHYDGAAGIVRFGGLRERVREGLAPVTPRHLANPHVRFFVERNPGHIDGDELACLADVRIVDIVRIAARLVVTRLRLAIGARGRPRVQRLDTP